MNLLLVFLTTLACAAAAAFGVAAWRARAEAERRSAARVAALASALASSGDGPAEAPQPVPVPSMFGSATTDTRLLTKPAIATAIAAAFLIAGGALLRNDAQPEAASRPDAAPLELLSRHHVHDGRRLTVTGVVRNPSTGTPLSEVAALVFAFNRGGERVASGRAALDVAVLEPGHDAPFSVTMADLPDVGRYQLGFRTPAGPLRHIDRRAAGQLVSAR